MKKNDDIISSNGNRYAFLESERNFHYLPPEENDENREKRWKFWNETYQMKGNNIQFTPTYPVQLLKENLANLRQLLIEVTDECNLACRYCGYGNLYGNYDARNNKKQKFENVKVLIDYLYQFWNSELNISHNNRITIGFYGGEPLMNFKLIQEIIYYLEQLNLPSTKFMYNMTTNAILLDRYMDYLAEKEFHLLISLDGNKYNDSYRVTKSGKPSFDIVVSNILKLKETHPDFFEKNVSFNAVLHNRNSVKEATAFIWETFGKIPRIGELTTNGIAEEKVAEFQAMFTNKFKSFEQAIDYEPLQQKLSLSPNFLQLNSFIDAFSTNTFHTYMELFQRTRSRLYIPTGTCSPFNRKIFLTVNGKILPCEKIGHQATLGYVHNGQVEINLEKIVQFYEKKYKHLIPLCMECVQAENCGQCVFLMKEKDGKPNCLMFRSKKKLRHKYFAKFITMLENQPESYQKILQEITID